MDFDYQMILFTCIRLVDNVYQVEYNGWLNTRGQQKWDMFVNMVVHNKTCLFGVSKTR